GMGVHQPRNQQMLRALYEDARLVFLLRLFERQQLQDSAGRDRHGMILENRARRRYGGAPAGRYQGITMLHGLAVYRCFALLKPPPLWYYLSPDFSGNNPHIFPVRIPLQERDRAAILS
ncbi:MAG: hypothetical protein WBN09_01850, partial [Woeseiaceae bacterium]